MLRFRSTTRRSFKAAAAGLPQPVALLSGSRCHFPSLVCGSYDTALMGPGNGSVRWVREFFPGQTPHTRESERDRPAQRTDRVGNSVDHGWGLVVAWDDSGARTGPHELGLIADIAARGDDEAARRLYRKYHMDLFRFGFHALHDEGLADEVVQETFVKFCRRAGTYDPKRGPVRGWLITMAKSTTADIARRPSSRPVLPLEDFHLPPQYDSVDEALTILTIDQALDELPSIYGDVMRLVRDGFTHSEIAERLEIPIGTVKSRMAKAASTLRAELADLRGGDDAF